MEAPTTAPWIVRPIRPGDDASVAAVIQEVMTEHGCTGEGFAIHDPEVAAMSAAYREANAAYYVVERAGEVAGGAGFAALQGSAKEHAVCELRKMYFRPTARGQGLAHTLLNLLIDEMRIAGFRRCYLETTTWMDRAQALYERNGFREQPKPEGATGHHGCDKFYSRQL